MMTNSMVLDGVLLKDIIRYNKAALKRAQTNLVNAQSRRDHRAVSNIQRKIKIYQATISIAEYYTSQGVDIQQKIEESGSSRGS